MKKRLKLALRKGLLRKAATGMLLFSFICSPLVTSAQITNDGSESSVTDTSSNTSSASQDAPQDGSQENISEDPGSTQDTPDTGADTGLPESPDTDASTDAIDEKSLDTAAKIPPMETASFTEDNLAGHVFISSNSTQSASPKVNTQTGALSFAYPLAIPPGREGSTPDLSLQYSSNDLDNSNVFGYGWSVSIPSISRTNKNGTNNIYASSTVFTSSLDGELVQVGTTTSYLPRTENGDFRKYTFSNNIWTVAGKDGSLMTFGSTTSARRDDPSNSSRIFTWHLEQSRNANDDYVQYTYYKNAGQIYPDTISYTNHASSTDGIFSIVFSRESRGDIMTSAETGFMSTTTYRTNRIEARINGSWVFAYDLGYTSGFNGARSVLGTITKSGKDENGTVTTLPTVIFTYESYTSGNKGWTAASTTVPVNITTTSKGYDNGSRFTDINADGLPDIVTSNGTDLFNTPAPPPSQSIYINNGNGWTSTTTWSIPTPLNRFGFNTPSMVAKNNEAIVYSNIDTGARFADVDHDGYSDIIWAYHAAHTNTSYSYSYDIGDVYINQPQQWLGYDNMDSSSWFLIR